MPLNADRDALAFSHLIFAQTAGQLGDTFSAA
jgi:hypothetical protein